MTAAESGLALPDVDAAPPSAGAALLISEDCCLCERIRAALEERGFALRHERHPDALTSAFGGTYRLVLLDASSIGFDALASVRPQSDVLDIGRVRVIPTARVVQVEGVDIKLTAMEYDVLEYLARAAGRVVPRDELMAAVWRRPASPLDRALDVHISHLRRKLRSEGGRILTLRSIGYMLALQRGDAGDGGKL